MIRSNLPPEVAAAIGHYVYALQDPRDGAAFYVGKGVGDRIHAHLREASGTGDAAKLRRIREIQSNGSEVRHLIIRSGLRDDAEALAVEQAVIDALTLAGASGTNRVKGHGHSAHGLATVEGMVSRYGADPMAAVDARILFVKIDRQYRPTDGQVEIYQHTQGHWKLSHRSRESVTYGAGVAFGVVRGVYRIESWFPSEVPGDVARWGFNGEPAPELAHIVGTSVRHLFKTDGQQNPVNYYWPGRESGAPRPWSLAGRPSSCCTQTPSCAIRA